MVLRFATAAASCGECYVRLCRLSPTHLHNHDISAVMDALKPIFDIAPNAQAIAVNSATNKSLMRCTFAARAMAGTAKSVDASRML